jgi:hypothetical protein
VLRHRLEVRQLAAAPRGWGGGGKVIQKYRRRIRFIILAPESREVTWDAVRGEFSEEKLYVFVENFLVVAKQVASSEAACVPNVRLTGRVGFRVQRGPQLK